MDLSSRKKRKTEENGVNNTITQTLTLSDAEKLISTLINDDLKSIVVSSLLESPYVLAAVRAIANKDLSQRKIFIRGLGWDTNNSKLHDIFSQFGELEEAVVICDKANGKSKGFGFITFKNIDGAILALKEPNKKVDGRMTVSQLALSGTGNAGAVTKVEHADVAKKKIYVGNVPADMPAEKLIDLFSKFGEIEEGPLGLDKQTGKFRGYTLFVYKTTEAARAALAEPVKSIDGCHMVCKLATDGKKKSDVGGNVVESKVEDDRFGFGLGGPIPGNEPGGTGNPYSYSAAAAGGMQGPPYRPMNSPLRSSVGSGQPLPGSITSGGYGTGGGFSTGRLYDSSTRLSDPSAGGLYGSFSQLSGPGAGGLYRSSSQFLHPGAGGLYRSSSQFLDPGAGGLYGSSLQFPVPGAGGPGGYGRTGGIGAGIGSSLHDRGPVSMGSMEPSGYLEGRPGSYSARHAEQYMGSPPRQRMVPSGGMYQGVPPYY